MADRTAVNPDATRSLWYGLCGYWTTDWSKLGNFKTGGIPCCPWCRAPGFITTEKEWWKNVDAYEQAHQPGYRSEIEAKQEKCSRQQEMIDRTRHG